MKFTITHQPQPDTVLSYPCLMQLVGDPEKVVLFTSKNSGCEVWPAGFGPQERWSDCTSLRQWIPFVGTIEVGP